MVTRSASNFYDFVELHGQEKMVSVAQTYDNYNWVREVSRSMFPFRLMFSGGDGRFRVGTGNRLTFSD